MTSSTPHRSCLGEIIALQRGFDLPESHRKDGDIPVIASTGVVGHHAEKRVDGPGVVIGRSGSIGGGQYIAGDFWPLNTTLWVKDFKGHDPRFIYYLLRSIDFTPFNAGAGVPTLNRNHLDSIAVPSFSEPQENLIASVLSAYDDLIDNNRRRMGLLEEAARQLYREWFVRLRFPGHEGIMITKGLPAGWGRKPLKHIAPDFRQTADPSELEPATPYIGLEHMPRRSITLTEWGTADQVTSTKLRYRAGDILFGKIRPYLHKVGFALTDGVSSSDSIIIRPAADQLQAFVLLTVSSDWFVAVVSKTAKEGSKMPRADWNLMETHEVAVPPPRLLNAFRDIAQPLLSQLKTIAFQNQKLRAARDLLLPRLMSGQLAI
jgi:type I restriction enzyme, S subunit